MKVIIAGTRTITDMSIVERAIKESGFDITEVVCGGARGVDDLGRKWSYQNEVNLKIFQAQWEKYGKSAGILRNYEMAQYADALIAIWDGESRGTKDMIKKAKLAGLKVSIYIVTGFEI